MHIAHLLRKYNPVEWGGTETVMCQLVDGLRREGVTSTVYSPSIPAMNCHDPLVEAGGELRRFKAVLPVWGLTAEQRRQMVAVGGNLLSFDLPRMLWADRGISVIHAHTLGRIGGVGLTLARRKKIPFVVTVHGGVYDLPDSLRRSFDAGARRGLEWGKAFGLLFRSRSVLDEADAIFTCNRREAAMMRERHPDRRVIVQPHGVPARLYTADHRDAALQAYPALRGRTVVLSLGRVDAVKNQGWLIEQLPVLRRRCPDVLLVLAGACTDEAYGEHVRKRVEELGLQQQVLVTGKLPPADPRLIGLLQVARVVALPSVSETFGIVILEAWAAGTPAISSRTSGASALIEHGRSGWLFDLEQPRGFHAAITAALAGSGERGRIIAEGRRRVLAEYDSQLLASKVREVYVELVEERHALRHSA